MTNADKFQQVFGIYATELWAMPEKDFLEWLNSEVGNCSEIPNSWIPCTPKTMPEEFESVLTTISIRGRKPRVRSGYYHNGLFSNDNGDCWKSTDAEVTAWQPLPSPFRLKEDES